MTLFVIGNFLDLEQIAADWQQQETSFCWEFEPIENSVSSSPSGINGYLPNGGG